MSPSPDLVLLHAPSVYDFRQQSILHGPVSDLVPSTPVFEMYPIGFTTLAEYLERHGFRVRIVNLAVRMLHQPDFDVEACLRSLAPAAFGLDLHWLPHAHGALAIAERLKTLQPKIPVILGGFSASFYADEILRLPYVDYVIRGDSTEEPLRMLMASLTGRAAIGLAGIPNLSWRERDGSVRHNPIGYCPADLDHVMLDYRYVLRAAARDLDVRSYVPFKDWLDYPIMAALTCRGCTKECVTCGGSASAFRLVHGRSRPAFRSPERLAQDVQRASAISRGPVFVLGDLRQAGHDYAQRFLAAMGGFRRPVIVELFAPATDGFLRQVSGTFSDFTLEVSLESHDPAIRRAFGKPYDNEPMERTIAAALDAGARRVDVFFMIGLPKQTPESVMATVDYAAALLRRFGGDGRLAPFISPLAPFLDPGSRAFAEPQRHGYRLLARTLEEHRRRLVAPSWKWVLNYETRWLSRDELVAVTYAAGRRMNQLKAEHGLVTASQATATERRIDQAVAVMGEIDCLVTRATPAERERRLAEWKPLIDRLNMSTVCDKRELNLAVRGPGIRYLTVARLLAAEAAVSVGRRLQSALRSAGPGSATVE